MTTFADLPEVVTATEAAELFGLARTSVYRWLKKGQLTPCPSDGPMQFRTADIVAIVGQPSFHTHSLEMRLWNKVQKTDSCWLWVGSIHRAGYGRITVNRRSYNAHRFVYELLVGPIPAGLELDHLCRNRACVNPDHLEPVTKQENNRRSMSASAENARKTHCARGHEFTLENTYVWRKTTRQCKTCWSIRNAERRDSGAASS